MTSSKLCYRKKIKYIHTQKKGYLEAFTMNPVID